MPFLLLCGIPGAGKTTLSNQIVSSFSETNKFCFDDFVASQLSINFAKVVSVDASLPSSSETSAIQEEILKPLKVYRKSWEQHIENFLQKLGSAPTKFNCSQNRLVILDDNFYLQSQRRTFVKVGKKFGLKSCCIKIVINVVEAQERVSERNLIGKTSEILKVNANTIKEMNEKFEDSGVCFRYTF